MSDFNTGFFGRAGLCALPQGGTDVSWWVGIMGLKILYPGFGLPSLLKVPGIFLHESLHGLGLELDLELKENLHVMKSERWICLSLMIEP